MSRKAKNLIAVVSVVILFLVLFVIADRYMEQRNAQATSRPEATGASDENDTEAETPQPEATTDPAAAEDPVVQQANSILASMTQEEKVYQLFMVTPEQLTGVSPVTQSGEASKTAIAAKPVGGVIYFAENLRARAQCTAMIQNLQSYSKLGLFIGVDEEGGTVARLGNNPAMGTTRFPAMGDIGKTGDATQAYQVGMTIGTDLKALGFNLDFAPVADVNSNPDNPVIGTRAFSSDPTAASAMVAACVSGFQDSGILCTLKHFPGHGDTAADSHVADAVTNKTADELRACELLPFSAGIQSGAPVVMVGHIRTPAATQEDVPATLSAEVIGGMLRGELKFQGLVITDSLSMAAITDHYTPEDAAVKALQAGADLLLMPQNLDSAAAGITQALQNGALSEARLNESILRILEAKIRYGIIVQ